MTPKKNACTLALLGALWAGLAPALAEAREGPPGLAAAARHADFKSLGTAAKAVFDELKKDAPDPTALRANAMKIKAYSAALPTWFPKGSGPEAGVKTDAKAELWSDPRGFADAANRFRTEASRFDQLAATSDIAGMRAQARALGGACKGCHDRFRVPEKN